MSDFALDLSASSAAFLNTVWPVIKPRLGGGELVPVESSEDKNMVRMLDMYCGIDGWHVSNNRQMRGIASRVQWSDKSWDSFTVRYARDSGAKTEYEKRKEDIEAKAGWLFPYVTVQAYLSGTKQNSGELLSVAIIKTDALISACDEVVSGKATRDQGGIRRTGNASFIWCNWDWLANTGHPIKIIRTGLLEAA